MNWLRRFMAGRYGADQLGYATIFFYLFLFVVGRVVGRWSMMAYSAIEIISTVLMVWCVFRLLSRNINKRYQENQVFMKYWGRVKKSFSGYREWFYNKKLYKYFKCPACGIKVRVPKGKGNIEITCPKCGRTFRKKS